MRKPYFLLLAFLIFSSVQGLHAEKTKDLALQAIRSKNYDQAITLCLKHLNTYPNDSSFNFMLAQAYAHSNRWQEALNVLEKIMTAHPDNMDALLLWSRVKSWEGEYKVSENGYRKVLLIDANNIEAKIGLAETASWTGDYAKAIDIYKSLLLHEPSNPEIYYRLGLVFKWEGNYAKAKENFRTAVGMDPDNQDYQRALAASRPQFGNKLEVRYLQRIESFSDDREHYRDQSVIFLFAPPGKRGTFVIEANQTRRLNGQDRQFGIEYYPQLWKGAYGFFDLSYSPKALWYPQTSFGAEVYQTFLSSAEFSLGYRRMSFEENPVSIYLGSLGYYLGNFYSTFRWYYSARQNIDSFSWTVNVRRYFSQDNFLFVSYGQGSRLFDAATIDDFLITQNRSIQTGVIWYLFQRIRLEFHMRFTDEKNGPNRNVFYLSSGYRW
jgi:YaiO family outer membrane protein